MQLRRIGSFAFLLVCLATVTTGQNASSSSKDSPSVHVNPELRISDISSALSHDQNSVTGEPNAEVEGEPHADPEAHPTTTTTTLLPPGATGRPTVVEFRFGLDQKKTETTPTAEHGAAGGVATSSVGNTWLTATIGALFGWCMILALK